jgi:hypothetical protein
MSKEWLSNDYRFSKTCFNQFSIIDDSNQRLSLYGQWNGTWNKIKKKDDSRFKVLAMQINFLLSIAGIDDFIDTKQVSQTTKWSMNDLKSSKIMETVLLIKIFLALL